VVWVPLAVAFFGAIEVGQFFLPTRVPDPTDVGVGVAVSLLGVVVGQSLRRGTR
jgi:VanZ family protein